MNYLFSGTFNNSQFVNWWIHKRYIHNKKLESCGYRGVSGKNEKMKMGKKDVRNFIGVDLLILKNKASEIWKVDESNSSQGIVRIVYEFVLHKPVLFFEYAEQIEFNGVIGTLILTKTSSSFDEYKNIINKFVDLVGSDVSNGGYVENNELDAQRYWNFSSSGENIKIEGDDNGFRLWFQRYGDDSILQISGLTNLYS